MRRWWYTSGRIVYGTTLLIALSGMGCSLDGLLNSDQVPPNLSDPAITQTPEGARRAYNGTLAQFRHAFGDQDGSFVAMSGVLGDELQVLGNIRDRSRVLDQRNIVQIKSDPSYSSLQKVRGQAGQSIRLLNNYLSDQPALAGHLYALEGYAEVFLAELFCSGIPLSTITDGGGFTYQPGSTTTQVFTHAVALFDTALTLAGDSARLADLARVGRARALLALGEYATAAASVTAVADTYRYNVIYNSIAPGDTSLPRAQNFATAATAVSGSPWGFSVPDHEGINGMNWRTSGDPRTPVTAHNYMDGFQSLTNYRPSNYAADGSTPIVLASGIEARLIEAEAALQAGSPTWLATLNALRTDGTFDTTATTPPDTLWHAGSGGVAGLAPLADPSTPAGRVDLLFRERAFWLFLTGHRQGDLRRLIRQYGRLESDVYPVGPYTGLENYGSDVTVPVSAEEFVNPLYTGCASRAA